MDKERFLLVFLPTKGKAKVLHQGSLIQAGGKLLKAKSPEQTYCYVDIVDLDKPTIESGTVTMAQDANGEFDFLGNGADLASLDPEKDVLVVKL